MISASGVTREYGKRVLFENVNLMFTPGNCYGLIGANGSGKSTFLKILSGEIEVSAGEIAVSKGERISTLKQDQFAYDEYSAIDTVIMGHKRLFDIMREKEALYAKVDFSETDGMRASQLEEEFTGLDGWNAEAEAAKLLSDLGIEEKWHSALMKQLESSQKVRVLLAQALLGDPDILLLDEPTNHLDVETCLWLEEFLCNFKKTAIVVSHDRHFLDQVCTHVADIDFRKIQIYTGNYTFWAEASELALRQRSEANKKTEDKRKDLQAFIARFSANASKSRQATSRKKLLEKLTLENIRPSSRRYPGIFFKSEKEAGNDLLEIENFEKSVEGELMFHGLRLRVKKGEKVAFVGPNNLAKTTLFQILMGEIKQDRGNFKWGVTTTRAYFPKENGKYFKGDLSLVDWLRQFSAETDDNFIRGFLGRMLFSGGEALKKTSVLSGGERVRCMLARVMLMGANVLILDEPTNHLDLESIAALNKGLELYKGTVLFTSHDHRFVQTVANRIVELTPLGLVDSRDTTYDEYLCDPQIKIRRAALYDQTNPAIATH
jgi:ATPase subunit of ABC transporter with duplicated ATPase domains